ncbi:MAG: alpha/beta hydrolase [Acidimicrobiales bacterium]|nr:alpha/beta hydrolase [Acidimicrobiales bacterium]
MSPAGAGRVAVVALLVVAAVSCGGDDAPDTSEPYRVGTRSVTFVDDERSTPAFGEAPAEDTRTLVTDLWYPARGDAGDEPLADAPAADGPFPLVVFNHGQQGEPEQYAPSFETWARAGYVVAAPRHPVTVRDGPGGQFVDDIEGELGDVPFVITSIDEELSDLADVDELAVAGHSSGAIVAFANAFNTCCQDERIDAVLVQALLNLPLDGEYAPVLRGTPVMFMHGDADLLPIDGAHDTFEAAEPPKYFLTIEGGDHSEAYRSGEPAPWVAAAALAFFDLHLKGEDEALDTLEGIAGVETVP